MGYVGFVEGTQWSGFSAGQKLLPARDVPVGLELRMAFGSPSSLTPKLHKKNELSRTQHPLVGDKHLKPCWVSATIKSYPRLPK